MVLFPKAEKRRGYLKALGKKIITKREADLINSSAEALREVVRVDDF